MGGKYVSKYTYIFKKNTQSEFETVEELKDFYLLLKQTKLTRLKIINRATYSRHICLKAFVNKNKIFEYLIVILHKLFCDGKPRKYTHINSVQL